MNRSHSRFVPHSRPVVAARNTAKVSSSKQRRSGRAYWFPIVTMIAAVMFAASAVMPRSVFDAFADSGNYSLRITSGAGSYTVIVTGDVGDVSVSPESVGTFEQSGDNVVLTVNLSGSTTYTITSADTMNSVQFGGEAGAVTSVNVENTGISVLDLSNSALSTSAYEIPHPAGITFKLAALKFKDSAAKGVTFDVPGAYDDGEFANLTATLPDGSEITRDDSEFYLTNEEVNKALGENDSFTVTVVNSTISDATFTAVATKANVEAVQAVTTTKGGGATKSGETFTVTYQHGEGASGDDYVATEVNNGAYTMLAVTETGFTAPEGKVFDKWELVEPTDKEYPVNVVASDEINVTSNVTYKALWKDQDTGSDPTGSEGALTVDDKSKSVIKSASLDTNENIDISKLKIVAAALSAADKKTLVAAIKKADTKFNESNPGSYYNIYIVGADGKQLNIKGSVTMTLAFPSAQVEYLYDEYTCKAYHQLSDNSIETLACSASASGLTFTTPSCSKFAVVCTQKEQNYTNLPIADVSRSYALSAIAHQGTTYVDGKENPYIGSVRMVVEKPSDSSKNAFLTAIKAFDKDFNKDDKNLLVYDIYPADESGKRLTLASGRIDVTLAYPSNTVKKNYNKYSFKVYHQLDGSSVETKQLAVGGKDGITVTSNSFSLFAIASISNNSNGGGDNPGTGESNVSANIALLLALLSMVSFAGVYAKNKAEQF